MPLSLNWTKFRFNGNIAPQGEIIQKSCWWVEESSLSLSSLPQYFLCQYKFFLFAFCHCKSYQISEQWQVVGEVPGNLRILNCFSTTHGLIPLCMCDTFSVTEFMFRLAGLLLQLSVKKHRNYRVVYFLSAAVVFFRHTWPVGVERCLLSEKLWY